MKEKQDRLSLAFDAERFAMKKKGTSPFGEEELITSAKDEKENTADEKASNDSGDNVTSVVSKPKILLVDDNYDFYQVVSLSFENILDIEYAQDGFTAFQMVRKKNYDLILCDILMPMINGLALLHEFKKKHINIPFLFITGNLNDKIIREAFHAGAFNLIEKPFDKGDLLAKVRLAISLNREEKPSEINEQDKAYIYNTLKMHYYDVDKIIRLLKNSGMPVSAIHQELDKKTRTGKCAFDDLSSLKYYRHVS